MDLESEIRKLYIDHQLPLRSVAERLNISTSTLRRRMKSFDIQSRDKNHGRNDWWQTKEYLSNSYVKELKSSITIAKEVGSSPGTVISWLKNFDIERREKGGSLRGKTMSLASRAKISAARKGKYLGESNPNWKGNKVSDEVRERRSYIAKKWRALILERDSNKCQKCANVKNLHVHHIKEFKDYPDLRWDVNNGITVCVSCHEKIHSRRFPDWLTGRITKTKDVVKIKPRIEFEGSPASIMRDEDGIAKGGIRLPQVEAPLAVNSAIPLKPDIFAYLGGSCHPFTSDQISARYGDRSSFLHEFESAAKAAVSEGVLRPREISRLTKEADEIAKLL